MTKRFSWPRTLRKIGTIGRAIDVKAANANQLYRRHRLEELDIFDGSRFGFRPRAAGFWGRWGQYRASWWQDFYNEVNKKGNPYVVLRADQLHWIVNQIQTVTVDNETGQ